MRTAIIIILLLGALSCSRNSDPVASGNPDTSDTVRAYAIRHLMLSDTQVALGNITTQEVAVKPIGQTVSVTGKFVVDEDYSSVVSSRAAGRIERLYVKETGTFIQKGEPLYTLYSETLLTLQREYLLAKAQYEALGKDESRYENFLQAAERKLRLYGLSSAQIQQLAKAKSEQNLITFLAPASGIVTKLAAAEGQYVAEGSVLYMLDDLNHLWLEAELYPQETSLVRVGDHIQADTDVQPSPLEGQVIFLSPEYNAVSQITRMRAAISNPDLVVKPGMQAQVHFMHSVKKAIAVPMDAVIRDGKGAHVYVQSEKNTFEPRMVKLGLENFELVEITAGLSEHETIAVTGAYLLYSEFVLKRGINPMAEHQHHH
jgi:Cu(I)/Ag(I) efflux system membrane fusion protein